MTVLNGVLLPIEHFSITALLCCTNLNNPGLRFQIQRTFFFMIKHFKSAFLFIPLLLSISGFAQNTVTGIVHNMTKGQPVAGDDVVLLRLGQGMQQESRAKTNAQGAFSLNVASPNEPHLLRVIHQGVNYDQPFNGSGSFQITVYDAVPRIPNLKGPIGVVQIDSDGKVLNVSEAYDVTNNSDPPVTQARADNFVITVPGNAVIDSAEARRGQGIWLKVTPQPVKDKPGRYLVDFPIRPGDTLLKFGYHMPYESGMTLHLRVPYPIEKFGVLHPPSITFKALRPNTFDSPPGLANGLKLEASMAQPLAGDVPAFQISGVGTAPEHGTAGAAAPPAASSGTSAETAPPAPAQPDQQPPARTPAPAAAVQERGARDLWVILAAIILLVIIGVTVLLRMTRRPVIAAAGPASERNSTVEALKEELFQLETERAQGAISGEEYASAKDALNKSLERALKRPK
jgi:hypothetical protein